jgi:hypothetical protein
VLLGVFRTGMNLREAFKSSAFYLERKDMASLGDLPLIHEDEISVPVGVLRLRSGGEK